MRIFTYGIEERKMDAIRWHFGRAEYIDTTSKYQDILALCADAVIIAVEHTPSNIVNTVKLFEEETQENDDTNYYYVTDNEIDNWCMEY